MIRLNDIGMDNVWSDLEGVTEWFSGMQERAAVKNAFYFGSLLSEQYGDVTVR
jgi:4-hydroxy-3-methylbut-2-en-1-yl diphosphate synthase IspG/GcpE